MSKNWITGSAAISLISISFPFWMTSGCLFIISHPMWEKKNPRLALCGSAVVSEKRWWVRWSLIHLYMCVWQKKTKRKRHKDKKKHWKFHNQTNFCSKSKQKKKESFNSSPLLPKKEEIAIKMKKKNRLIPPPPSLLTKKRRNRAIKMKKEIK